MMGWEEMTIWQDCGLREYAAHPWPRVMRFAPELLGYGGMISEFANGDIFIRLENGSATYEKIDEGYWGDWVCRLLSATYEPLENGVPS